jgi:oligogalacturonide transport system substrate-binding protein
MKAFVVIGFIFSCFAQTVFAENSVTLRFSWWGGDARHKPTIEAIKLFEAANPGINIKGEYMGWNGYPERLTTQFSGNNEPDIMQINWAWISTMLSKDGNGFFDLNNAKSELKLDEWGSSLQTGMWKGKLNAIPVSYTARTFIWQKTIFDKAGLPIPKTWDEFLALGKSFETKLGKNYYPMDGQVFVLFHLAHAYILQKTGKPWIDPATPKVALNKEEVLEFIRFYKKLAASRAVVPLQLRLSTAGPETPLEQIQSWVVGEWAGSNTWDSDFKTRLSSLPKTTTVVHGDFLTMKGAKNSGFYGRPSMMLAVSKNCKKPLIAAKFINFMLTNPEAVKILKDTRGIPLAKSAVALLKKENKISPLDIEAAKEFARVKIDVPSAYVEHARIQEHLRLVFEQISLEKITDEQGVIRLTDETNKILASIQ